MKWFELQSENFRGIRSEMTQMLREKSNKRHEEERATGGASD